MAGLSLKGSKEMGFEILELVTNPKYSSILAPALFVVDAVLCTLIIKMVDYTEIDWKTYMQQIALFIGGEHDYMRIKGDTGPIVYPALHTWIYRGLHSVTSGGNSILLAQIYFALLYLINLALVMVVYLYAKAPPFVFPMLIASKRLHSIYLLRCFNDCWAVGFLFLAIFLFQKRQWTWGALAYSCAVGVKMTALLAAPAIAIILYQAVGPIGVIVRIAYMLLIQIVVALPFLQANAVGYLSRAFQFNRQFLYEWSVNWKFVKEETFSSQNFSTGLLAAHASFLLLFIFTRWFRPLGRSPTELLKLAHKYPSIERQKSIIAQLNTDFIVTTILSCLAIGLLFARTLHYQFYAWIAWTTPFLLWRSKINPGLQYVLWIGQEVAWNVYPSNDLSSKIVVGVLAVAVVEIWLGSDEPMPEHVEMTAPPADPNAKPKQKDPRTI